MTVIHATVIHAIVHEINLYDGSMNNCKKCIFSFLEMFGNEKKKEMLKKRKRPGTVRNFGNKKVVSTISALEASKD